MKPSSFLCFRSALVWLSVFGALSTTASVHGVEWTNRFGFLLRTDAGFLRLGAPAQLVLDASASSPLIQKSRVLVQWSVLGPDQDVGMLKAGVRSNLGPTTLDFTPTLPGVYDFKATVLFGSGTTTVVSNRLEVAPAKILLTASGDRLFPGETNTFQLSIPGVDPAIATKWIQSRSNFKVSVDGQATVRDSSGAPRWSWRATSAGRHEFTGQVWVGGHPVPLDGGSFEVIEPRLALSVTPSGIESGEESKVHWVLTSVPADAWRVLQPISVEWTASGGKPVDALGTVQGAAWIGDYIAKGPGVHRVVASASIPAAGGVKLWVTNQITVTEPALQLAGPAGPWTVGSPVELRLSDLTSSPPGKSVAAESGKLVVVVAGETNVVPWPAADQLSWKPTRAGETRLAWEGRIRGAVRRSLPLVQPVVEDSRQPTLARQELKALEGEDLVISVPVPNLPYRRVEMGFVFDGTGSMKAHIESVRQASESIFRMARRLAPNVAAFSYSYGATHPREDRSAWLQARSPMTEDPAQFSAIRIEPSGGHELPLAALWKVAQVAPWRPESLRLLLLVADDGDDFFGGGDQDFLDEAKLRKLFPDRLNWTHLNRAMDFGDGRRSGIELMQDLFKSGYRVGILTTTNWVDSYRHCIHPALGEASLGVFPVGSGVDSRQVETQLESLLGRVLADKSRLRLRSSAGAVLSGGFQAVRPTDAVDGDAFRYGDLARQGIRTVEFKTRLAAGFSGLTEFLVEVANEDGTVLVREVVRLEVSEGTQPGK